MSKKQIYETKIYEIVVRDYFENNIFKFGLIHKETGCKQHIYVKILNYYVRKQQSSCDPNKNDHKIKPEEKAEEDFGPLTEEEKELPSLGFEDLIEYINH